MELALNLYHFETDAVRFTHRTYRSPSIEFSEKTVYLETDKTPQKDLSL